MATYSILSRLAPDAFTDPGELKQLAATVAEKIRSECPGVTWKDSYLTLGRFDFLDVVESNDLKQLDEMLTTGLAVRGTLRMLGAPRKSPLCSGLEAISEETSRRINPWSSNSRGASSILRVGAVKHDCQAIVVPS